MNFSSYPKITKVIIPNGTKLQNGVVNLFYNLTNLKTIDMSENLFANVDNMSGVFYSCCNFISSPICNNNITNMCNTYYGCRNLIGSPTCGDNVSDMSGTYYNCTNLTGSPVCGNNVTNMCNTYYNCHNLTGSPACGDNVSDMFQAYRNCYNLTGSPACGNSVTNMSNAYSNCYNLTGAPVCGDNVVNMSDAYINCYNLCTPLTTIYSYDVTNMKQTYFGCPNIFGNMYIYSPNISNAYYCLHSRNASNMLNIYVPANSTSQATLTNYSSYLVGHGCLFTEDATNNRYYNTQYNVYIYPTEDVPSIREINGDGHTGLIIGNKPKTEYMTGEKFDPTGMTIYFHHDDDTISVVTDYAYIVNDDDVCVISHMYKDVEYTINLQLYYPALSDFEYTDNGDGTYTITDWKGTLGGKPSTKMYIPLDSSIIL